MSSLEGSRCTFDDGVAEETGVEAGGASCVVAISAERVVIFVDSWDVSDAGYSRWTEPSRARGNLQRALVLGCLDETEMTRR